jgi:hypothetical protein
MGFRISRQFKYLYHPEKVAKYRRFSGQMSVVYWNDPEKHTRILDTNFRMYMKHLDLPTEYRMRIIIKLKEIYSQLIRSKFFSSRRNREIARQLFQVEPSIKTFMQFVFSAHPDPLFYWKVTRKLAQLTRINLYAI